MKLRLAVSVLVFMMAFGATAGEIVRKDAAKSSPVKHQQILLFSSAADEKKQCDLGDCMERCKRVQQDCEKRNLGNCEAKGRKCVEDNCGGCKN